jgi:hypothetical protein
VRAEFKIENFPALEEMIGVGYTLATGRLFCRMDRFHAYAEKLMQRPVLTHEFGSAELWDELRQRFERCAADCAVNEGWRGSPEDA